MKWMTVEEYAKKNRISKTAAYKRIKVKSVSSEKRFGKIVIKDSK